MGCAASSPASVVDGITAHNNQNAQECVTEAAKTVEAEVTGRCSDTTNQESDISKAAKRSPAIDRHSSFKDLESAEEPIIIKADAQGLLQPSGKPNADGTIPKTEGKKGFVAFEVSLDGVVEPTLDSSRRQLPKRLKHLEPLEGAPKLTAEELNEKLERAEQKRLKVLAKRKNGLSRRTEKHGSQTNMTSSLTPDQTGDAPNENVTVEVSNATTEQGEDTPLEFEREEAAQGRTLETGRSNNSESQENTDSSDANSPIETEDKDEITIEQPAFEVLDNNNSNNNAQDCSRKDIDRVKGTPTQRLMNRRSIVQRPLRGRHPKEHEEEGR
ncbi:hypothetical protein AAHC03_013711 [Spirometra sp. Aus1]